MNEDESSEARNSRFAGLCETYAPPTSFVAKATSVYRKYPHGKSPTTIEFSIDDVTRKVVLDTARKFTKGGSYVFYCNDSTPDALKGAFHSNLVYPVSRYYTLHNTIIATSGLPSAFNELTKSEFSAETPRDSVKLYKEHIAMLIFFITGGKSGVFTASVEDAFRLPYAQPVFTNLTASMLHHMAHGEFSMAHHRAGAAMRVMHNYKQYLGFSLESFNALSDDDDGGLLEWSDVLFLRAHYNYAIFQSKYFARSADIEQLHGVLHTLRNLMSTPTDVVMEIPNADEDQQRAAEIVQYMAGIVTGEGGVGKTWFLGNLVKTIWPLGWVLVCSSFGSAVENVRKALATQGIDLGSISSGTIDSWICRKIPYDAEIVVPEAQMAAAGRIYPKYVTRVYVIIDECSTVDLHKLFALLANLDKFIVYLYMTGDIGQLGPVNAFPIISALLAVKLKLNLEVFEDEDSLSTASIPWLRHYELTVNHRTSAVDLLYEMRNIRKGIAPKACDDFAIVRDWRFLADMFVCTTRDQLLKWPDSVMFVSPVNSCTKDGTAWGVNNLNEELRAICNPMATENIMLLDREDTKRAARQISHLFHCDLVVITKNHKISGVGAGPTPSGDVHISTRTEAGTDWWFDWGPVMLHEHRVYNGELGMIVQLNGAPAVYMLAAGLVIPIQLDNHEIVPVICERSGISHRFVQAAYARTVHKSQGTQADHVICLWHWSLARQGLYTALSRSKKKAYFLPWKPSNSTLETAAKNNLCKTMYNVDRCGVYFVHMWMKEIGLI